MMKRAGVRGAVLLLVLIVLAAVPVAGLTPAVAAAGSLSPPALLVDGRPVTPVSPLLWDAGTVLVALKDLSAFIEAGLQWNGAEKTVWIQKHGRTIFFSLKTGKVLKNSVLVTAPLPARLVGGTVYAPLRFVAENLGMAVAWNESTR